MCRGGACLRWAAPREDQEDTGSPWENKADFNEITLDPLFDWTKERSFEYLISLPGVGPKTAACVLAFRIGKAGFSSECHILRVAKRLGFAGEKRVRLFQFRAPLKIWFRKMQKMPLHVMLIEHGRNICSSRKPKCPLCPLSADCSYFRVKGG